jgi:uncharacterized protein
MWSWRRQAAAQQAAQISLFPLNAVLFPGGLLTLKVFDSRYLDLINTCLHKQTAFGVVTLKPRERSQAHQAASDEATTESANDDPEHEAQHAKPGVKNPPALEPVGVLAEPIDALGLQPGILQVRCQGTQRFELGEISPLESMVGVLANGLWQASFTPIADDEHVLPKQTQLHTVQSLATVINQLKAKGQHPFLKPYPFTQAGWVANRWCEILPISMAAKQRLMALQDPLARLDLVGAYLREKGLG